MSKVQITADIKHNKPNLSESSVKTYTNIVAKLLQNLGDEYEKDYFKTNEHKVLEYLKGIECGTRKTVVSAIVSLTKSPVYSKIIIDDNETYKKNILKGEKTQSQKDNWTSSNEIKTIFDALEKDAETVYNKSFKTIRDIQKVQQFVIIALTSGILIPPRRLLDWTEMKFKNIDKATDNYIADKKFIFNIYKTVRYTGEQSVDIPPELQSIIQRFLDLTKRINRDYLLFDNFVAKLQPITLNQRLHKIFGNKVGCNILRHVYLTERYKDVEDNLAKDVKAMGTSKAMLPVYIRK